MEARLRAETFRSIEREVYDLPETLKEMKLIRYEIEERSSRFSEEPQPGRNSVRENGSVTEKKATELMDHKVYKLMETKTAAILKVYESLMDEKKAVVKLYYWDRPGELTWEGVAKVTNTSRRTAIRWRRGFIQGIARELGER